MFVGRIERYKGVFDLVAVASEIECRQPGLVEWALCGTGSADAELRRAVTAARLCDIIHFRGFVNRTSMITELAWSGCADRTDDQSVCRRIEQGRRGVDPGGPAPGHLRAIQCASDVLGDAIVEVDPGDIQGYADAIQRLASDHEFYETKRRAWCFGPRSVSRPQPELGSALRRALLALWRHPNPVDRLSTRKSKRRRKHGHTTLSRRFPRR